MFIELASFIKRLHLYQLLLFIVPMELFNMPRAAVI